MDPLARNEFVEEGGFGGPAVVVAAPAPSPAASPSTTRAYAKPMLRRLGLLRRLTRFTF